VDIFLIVWAIEQWRDLGYHDSTIALMVQGIAPDIASQQTGREKFEDWTQRFYERNMA